MSIASILIHVENHLAIESRIQLAVMVAKKLDADLTALFIIPPFILPAYVSYELPAEVYRSQTKLAEKEAETVREIVSSIAAQAGVSIQFKVTHGSYIQSISRYARFSDLLVLGQSGGETSVVSPQEVILNSGRLSLVVPDSCVAADFPRRALVAFNGSPESVQTLHDAMPILSVCETVTVVSFDEKNSGSIKNEFNSEELSQYLSHHGVKAEMVTDTVKSRLVGEAVLDHAKDRKADVLVLGCYGHSRFREWVLGGTTNDVLESLPIPALMSH